MLLDDPTKGKLDPRWTGPWEVEELQGPSTVKIRMGTSSRLVHINRTRPLLQSEVDQTPTSGTWHPPYFEYSEDCDFSQESDPCETSDSNVTGAPVVTRSGRIVRPPDYYGH